MSLALCIDSLEDGRRVQVHEHTLVKKLIDDKDDSAHVLDKGPSLDALAEDSVEALVHAVEHLAEDQLVVLAVANDEDGHVRVAPEDGHVVVHCHDVVLVGVHAATRPASTVALLARFEEQLTLEALLLLRVLEWGSSLSVVVLGDEPLTFIVEQNAALDVADAP